MWSVSFPTPWLEILNITQDFKIENPELPIPFFQNYENIKENKIDMKLMGGDTSCSGTLPVQSVLKILHTLMNDVKL